MVTSALLSARDCTAQCDQIYAGSFGAACLEGPALAFESTNPTGAGDGCKKAQRRTSRPRRRLEHEYEDERRIQDAPEHPRRLRRVAASRRSARCKAEGKEREVGFATACRDEGAARSISQTTSASPRHRSGDHAAPALRRLRIQGGGEARG